MLRYIQSSEDSADCSAKKDESAHAPLWNNARTQGAVLYLE